MGLPVHLGAVLLLLSLASGGAMAQAPVGASQPAAKEPASAEPASAPADKEMIQLTLPENIEIKLLLEYVTKRLGINVLYDDALLKKKVVISAPSKIPKDSLLGLLNSVLKMNQLAMVDADQPGWKKIVTVGPDMSAAPEVARDANALEKAEATQIVTQVFQLKTVTTAFADQTIKPFLSKPGGNTFAIPDRNLLFVTDYAPSLRRIADMIVLVDAPGKKPTILFLPVKNLEAGELAREVGAFLTERDKLSPVAGKAAERRFTLTTEPRTNQLVIISTEEELDPELAKLVERLDVPTSLETRTYRLKFTSTQRIDRLARDLVAGSGDSKAVFKSVIDAESGILIVTAQPAVHKRIEELILQLDQPGAAPQQSNVRFYKLLNTTASQVLSTIRTMEGAGGPKGLAALASESGPPSILPEAKFTGPNAPPSPPGTAMPTPPAYRESNAPASQPAEGPAPGGLEAVKTSNALVTADTNTNTLIVIAPPEVQGVYQQLITILDKRRPQVMIEVTLVTLDTSHDFSLGVDLARAGSWDNGKNRFLLFSSAGLSAIDNSTGALTLTPGTGFNGVLLAPDIINSVVKALADNAHSKVVSAPKVLANDNATATLSSVSEAPFTSVNASQTVSTTSFAGYASAGTTVTVTPHISEGDHMHLQYSVSLSSFSGTGSGGIPPPRQTNTLNSDVTVPDGYAVVVGGLTRKDTTNTSAGFPFLIDIPAVKYFFGQHSTTDSQSTLFVFIRPVILRDDQFEDLKYLSETDLRAAELPSNLPSSEPQLIE